MTNDLKQHFLTAIKCDPKFSEAHFQLAIIYNEEGKYESAEKHLKEARKITNKNIEEIEYKAELLMKKFQFQNAKEQYFKAQSKRKHCSEINYQLSNIYLINKKYILAQQTLEASIKLNPSFSKAYRDLGILFMTEGKHDEARLQIEKAIDIDYSDSISHYNLGLIMKRSKDYHDAEQHFLSALDINPKFVKCMLELAFLYLITNDKSNAINLYNKAKLIDNKVFDEKIEKFILSK